MLGEAKLAGNTVVFPRASTKHDGNQAAKIVVFLLNVRATPHNAARADAEKKRVLIKAFFREATLCISRKKDEIRARFIRQMPQAYCAVLP